MVHKIFYINNIFRKLKISINNLSDQTIIDFIKKLGQQFDKDYTFVFKILR